MESQTTCSTGLVQVHPIDDCAGADTNIDIIAIHGLDTRSPDTWISKDPGNPENQINWLKHPDMLPKFVGQARIFTCDWPGKMLQKCSSTTLEASAQLLLDNIKEHLKQNKQDGIDRPVLFIASCFGGVILIKALEMESHGGDESDGPSLKTATRGIIFLATPFLGTSFEGFPDWILSVYALSRDETVSGLVDYTRKPKSNYHELVNRFDNLQREEKYQVLTFWEADKTNLLGRIYLAWMFSNPAFLVWCAVLCMSFVLPSIRQFWLSMAILFWILAFPICRSKQLVDENSATAHRFDKKRLNRKHIMMNKFDRPDCDDFKKVAEEIQKIVMKIGEGTPLKKADAWIRDKIYTSKRLQIKRLSDENLPLDQCYINLAIIEQSENGESRSKEGDAKGSPFSLLNRQKVKTPDKTIQVDLATIFNRRKGPDDLEMEPRRILIRGRAGMGKTTLCKKIVHEFTERKWVEWSNLFDRILWVPLRKLKLKERRDQRGYDFEHLFLDEYFLRAKNKSNLAKELSRASKTRTLFLLDGLDEVQDLSDESSISEFLEVLLNQPNVIITSRPSAKPPNGVDLELETIGFYPDQVTNYIERTFRDQGTDKVKLEKTREIQSYIQSHWLIQGLVRIPIQLDALCYTWDGLPKGTVLNTMTGMYEAIEQRLWKKDVLRLDTKQGGELVTPSDIATGGAQDLVHDKICFLQGLAFSGLYHGVIDFTSQHRNNTFRHFKQHMQSRFLLDRDLPRLSFLRTSDPSTRTEDREYHFIHLTFQEYFAARYFVQQWNNKEVLECCDANSTNVVKIEPDTLLKKDKYTARYDIFWRFVAGLLDAGGKAEPFINMIESEPLDLLGPTHQRLVMHCLSEVSGDIPTRRDIEQRLSKWLLFECNFRHTAHLAQEAEFPESALREALCEGSDNQKETIIESLKYRTTIPHSISYLLAFWLKHEEFNVRPACLKVLGGRSDLPEKILESVSTQLGDEDYDVRWAAIEVFRGRSDLPEKILEAVAARLGDEEYYVRWAAIEVLRGQSDLPEKILEAVAARLGEENYPARDAAVEVLRSRSDLPEKILEAVAARLGEENYQVRRAAIGVFRGQSDLPEKILEAVAARLGDEDYYVRWAAIEVFRGQSDLPEKILESVSTQLGDEDYHVRWAAIEVFRGQSDLAEKILEAVAARLGDEDYQVRRAAIGVLGSRSEKMLEAVAARLGEENYPVRDAAVEVLRSRSDLPKKILEAVASRLGHNDYHVRRAAIGVFRGQSNLPEKILEAVATQLGDEDYHVRRAAIGVLGGRSDLPKKILEAVASRLGHNGYHDRRAAIGVFRGQSNLPEKILESVSTQLGEENYLVRDAAVEVLRSRSDLPEKILEAVAARLGEENYHVRRAAIGVLGSRSDLPEKILDAVAARLGDDNGTVRRAAFEVSRKYERLYLTLINGHCAPFFYSLALQRSFDEEESWYIDDNGKFCINRPVYIRPTHIDCQENDVRTVIEKAKPTGLPSTSLRRGSPPAETTH